MPNALETPWVTLEVNDVPLSLCDDLGRPNHGMISWSVFFFFFFFLFFTTSSAFSVQMGKPSIHPVNGLVRGSSTIPLRVLSSGPRFLSKSERGEPLRVGRRVAVLRTSQGNIVRPGFSISITWYLSILWSDIDKWPIPFRSCFTWWLVKIVIFSPKESFKASSIRIAIAARFQRQGGQPQVVGSSLFNK